MLMCYVLAMVVLALQDGLSLLHRAVRSGSPNLVRGILDWGAAHHYTWPISSGGPGGITPLHLAALLEDDGVVALMLLDACDGPTAAFTDTRAADGVTPFHLAFQVGHYSLDRVLAGLGLTPVVTSVVEQQLQPTGWQLLKLAAEEDQQQGGAPAGTSAGSKSANGDFGALKERHTSCLDACLYCQSTLPPLLLSIKAHCAGCGIRQPCVAPGDEPGSPAAAVACEHSQHHAAAAAAPTVAGQSSTAAERTHGGCVPASAAPDVTSTAIVAAAAMLPAVLVSAGGDAAGCAHVNGRVLSVTALCQTCHANRVLEVA
jgi:hypothetical protein